MTRMYGLLTALLMLALFVAACGGQQAAENAPEQIEAPEESAADEATVSDADCQEGFQFVEHALGETCIPDNPERIVAIGTAPTEALLALDIIPVAIATWTGLGNTPDVPAYIADRFDLSESKFLGSGNAPNLEGVVAANPELIVASEHDPDLYESLSEIAPTIAFTWSDENRRSVWKDYLRDLATALGRSEDAESLLSTYTERANMLNAILEEQDSKTVSLLRFMPDEARIYLKDSYSGTILEDAGIQRPEAQQDPGFVMSISLESVQAADGDIILVAQGDPDGTMFEQFSNNPLWNRLEGVENDQVFQVNHSTWIGSTSVIAANIILDDLFRHVAKVDPQEVSPNAFVSE